MDAITTLAALTAIAAAARSTWSPCGVSMLSTITPVTESGRGRRYGVTVGWFLSGAVLGGLCLGGLGAVLALAGSAADLGRDTALGVAATALVIGAALDAAVGGLRVPGHGRQVNETWLTRFRSWIYGGGFGWQIGVGLATYIVTAGVYLVLLLMALTASPVTALAIGVLFGLVRGLAIFLGVRVRTYDQLAAFHRRFEAARAPSRRSMIGAQLLLAAAATGLAWGWPSMVVVAVAAAGIVATTRPEQLRVRARPGVTVPVELSERPPHPTDPSAVPTLTAGS